MDNIEKLKQILLQSGADFELIQQDRPILSVQDAAGYYDIQKAAPVFILQADDRLIAFIKSVNSGKINFFQLKKTLKCKKVEMAKPDVIKQKVGYEVGAVPLIGLSLPVIFDDSLLEYDYVYGGTGDIYYTLKIAPADVKRLNQIIL